MVKVISLPYIFQVLYVLCFTWPRHIAGERLQDHWSSGYSMPPSLYWLNLDLNKLIETFEGL